GNVGSRQRITILEVPLTSTDLPRVPPQWRRVVPEWIIHPLSYLMRHDGGVFNTSEQSGGIEINGREGLCRRTARAMKSQNATQVQVGGVALRHHHVIEQENWKG